MTRHAHLWLLLGMALVGGGVFAFWLSAMLLGELWSTGWGWCVPVIDALALAGVIQKLIERRQNLARRHLRISKELPCRWPGEPTQKSLWHGRGQPMTMVDLGG